MKRSSVSLMIRVIDAEHLQVGERVWWGEYYASDLVDDIPDMDTTRFDMHVRQFIVRFESGWRASIIWGNASYSDNHDYSMVFGNSVHPFVETPETVELAIFHKDHEKFQGGDVMGYMDEDDVNFTLDQMAMAHTTDSLIIRGHIALFLRARPLPDNYS